MKIHEKEAVSAISYDSYDFFMTVHEKEAVSAISYDSYDFFMKIHEKEAIWPFRTIRTIFS